MSLKCRIIFMVASCEFPILLDPESSPPMSTELFSDMKLTPKQNLAVMLGRDVGTGSNTFAGSDKVTLRWPNARVPFTIDCSLGMLIFISYLPISSHLHLSKYVTFSFPYAKQWRIQTRATRA